MIKDIKLIELTNLIADPKHPVPAGGSTIASSALLTVSLLLLILRISTTDNLTNYEDQLLLIKENLIETIEEDAKAFKLNLKENFNDYNLLKEIINIPVKIATNTIRALEITENIKLQIQNNLIADYQIAKLQLTATIKGAIAIIESNYQFFPADDPFVKEIKKKIVEINNSL